MSPNNPKNYLIFVVHHLVIDGLSWQIFLEDLTITYKKLLNQRAIEFTSTISYLEWAKYLVDYAKTEDLGEQRHFWLQYENLSDMSLPIDIKQGNNIIEQSSTITVQLDRLLTHRLLTDPSKAFNVSIDELLIIAIIFTIYDWIGQNTVYLSLENSGREDIISGIDLSRTIGWFTVIFPAILNLPSFSSLDQQIISVREQLRHITKYSSFYGMFRYLKKYKNSSVQLIQTQTPQIILDYFVNLDELYANKSILGKPVFIPLGESVSPRNQRLYLLEISHWVVDGQFNSAWTFSLNHHYPETIQHLSERFLYYLTKLINHSWEKNNFSLSAQRESST